MDVDNGGRQDDPGKSDGPEIEEGDIQVSNYLFLHWPPPQTSQFIEYPTPASNHFPGNRDIRPAVPCALHPGDAPHSLLLLHL